MSIDRSMRASDRDRDAAAEYCATLTQQDWKTRKSSASAD